MTTKQGDLLDAFCDAAEAVADDGVSSLGEATIDRLCIDTIIALVDHRIKETQYENAITQDATAIRARTTHIRCRYRIKLVPSGGRDAVHARTVEIARQLGSKMTGRQKGIIYCRSRWQSMAVSEALGCAFHHSGISEAARRASREVWGAGVGRPRYHRHQRAGDRYRHRGHRRRRAHGASVRARRLCPADRPRRAAGRPALYTNISPST